MMLQEFVKKCPNILSINLADNPVSQIAHKRYLATLLSTCPKVVKVDETIINPHVRDAFKVHL